MFRTTLVVLAMMARAQARPQGHDFNFQKLPIPFSAGESAANVNTGETIDPFGGLSTVTQHQSGTGGQAANGGFNTGNAKTGTNKFSGLLGKGTTSETDATSVQGTGFPGFPNFGGFPDFGSATGQAVGTVTQGKTTNPDGSQTVITSQGSTAGGSAKNGGTNVSNANTSTSSVDTIFGSQSTTNTNAQSTQTGR